MQHDPRLSAFINPESPQIFRSVLATNDVWNANPLDVEAIHSEARERFAGVVEASRTSDLTERIFIVRGDSGSGKTHLMSAFRASLHETNTGFFAYMQLTPGIDDYVKYMLYHVLESMEKRYRARYSDDSGLEFISRSILNEARLLGIPEAPPASGAIDALAISEQLIRCGRFTDIDESILGALLLVQRHDPIVTRRVMKYLRCDRLSKRESDSLDGLESRVGSEDPQLTLLAIEKVLRQLFDMPLVICIDQLDDIYLRDGEMPLRFAKLTSAVKSLTDSSTLVVVLSILDDVFIELRPQMGAMNLARFSNSVTLRRDVRTDEIRAVLSKRLQYLFETQGLTKWLGGTSVFPFDDKVPEVLAGLTLRAVLRTANEARQASIASGTRPSIEPPKTFATGQVSDANVPSAGLALSERWNIIRLDHPEIPESDAELGRLLADGLRLANREIEPDLQFEIDDRTGRFLLRRRHDDDERWSGIEIANKAAAGGGLGASVKAIAAAAKLRGETAIIVRTSDYPKGPKTKFATIIADALREGHRRIVMPIGEWETLANFLAFARQVEADPSFDDWIARDRPLTSLGAFQQILGLDEERSGGATSAQPPLRSNELPRPNGESNRLPSEATAPRQEHAVEDIGTRQKSSPSTESDPVADLKAASVAFSLGTSTIGGRKLEIEPLTLTRHTAILGGAGSGKTTLAFSLLEHLLQQGIPAILVDRKGDLATFADPEAWTLPVEPDVAVRRTALRERLDIQLFTPGASDGRDLGVPTIPANLGELSLQDRDEAARSAANGLAAMLAWGTAKKSQLAVLTQAIVTLGALSTDSRITLKALIAFIDSQDAELINAIGKLNPKLLGSVVNDLSSLAINAKPILAEDSDALDVEMLFGLGAHHVPGKTRLTILSTKALGEGAGALFWISRLLIELGRFGSRNPKPVLQAVVFFDEADLYLPATSKPATKEPMENLFKRARSAGIGMILATQSPGDLDYKSKENISTWLVGRVNQPQALKKLGPVFEPHPQIVDKFPALTVGTFYARTTTGTLEFRADLPVLMPKQLEEERILEIARAQSGTSAEMRTDPPQPQITR